MMTTTTVTAGLSPQHKAAVVLFLERVYGVQDQITFYRLLENGFLPDLRAATTLEEVATHIAILFPFISAPHPIPCGRQKRDTIQYNTLYSVYSSTAGKGWIKYSTMWTN